jgi:predicted metalloendopeptidase
MSKFRAAILAATALTFAAGAAVAQTAPKDTHDVDLKGIDKSIKPGDDFYRYANGAWMKTAQIPADRSSFGPGVVLTEKNSAEVRALIQDAAKGTPAHGSNAQKVGDYYASYMDEAGIEAKGLTPVKPELDAIAAVTDKASLSAYLGTTLRADVDALNATNFYTDHIFGVWITQGFEDPDHNVPYLLQGGLGMPDRDYYLDPSPKMAELRTKYLAHITNVLKLVGVADADAKAAAIMALETKMAQAHASRVDSEDVLKANNPWTRADFTAKAPGLDWDAYFKAAGLASQQNFIVWQPGAATGLSALVASEPVDTWKAWLTFHAIDHYAGVLPKAFTDERFAFYGTALTGTPQQSDRWKRAVNATSGALGEVVGQLYTDKYFPPASKAKINAIVDGLLTAYHARISNLKWMAPATKEEALAKLKTLKVGVGYPDKWIDYSSLDIVRGDAYGNVRRAEMFTYQRKLASLGQTPDRGEWAMVPQIVNAVNLPLANALNFPAGILQPPYFDPQADAAYNYGSIGATIGHEISHSFDDEGSQFDSRGRLRNWWTPEDAAHFKAASEKLAAQYDKYCPFSDLCVNGHQVLSENIADVAGLSAAYDAYKLSLHGKADVVKDGLTGDQRFFLAFTQSWRQVEREAALRQQIKTDGHAPDEYRGDTVRNLDAWYPAFKVAPGEKLYLKPEDRVQVW